MTGKNSKEHEKSSVVFPSSVASHNSDMLSKIEAQILSLYAAGLTRSEIARETGLSAHTVGHHLTAAKDKLHARSLAHAVHLMTRHS